MTHPIVSNYEQAFLDAFGRGVEEVPADKTKLVQKIVDEICETVTDRIMNYVTDEMGTIGAAHLREEAAKQTASMLSNALAGDDKEIRNLFGFNDWYMHYSYAGDLPTQWRLIDALVARRPDIFLDERLKQRDHEIKTLQQDKIHLTEHIGHLNRQIAGEEPQ